MKGDDLIDLDSFRGDVIREARQEAEDAVALELMADRKEREVRREDLVSYLFNFVVIATLLGAMSFAWFWVGKMIFLIVMALL